MKRFLVMKVNSGRERRVVEGRSLKSVRRRLGLRYLIQELPRTRDTIIANKEDVSLPLSLKDTYIGREPCSEANSGIPRSNSGESSE